jgi:hypothetical protein
MSMNLRVRHIFWGSFLVAGCASRRTDESVRPASSAAATTSASSAVPSGSPQYDVHEWGLIREDPNATYRIGAVAAPHQELIIITKPVLYFRADAPLTLKRVSVAVPGGNVVETWPLAKKGADKDTFEWRDVSIDPTSPCKSSRLPRKIDPPCSLLPANDLCESAGLAAVRTVDASCVRVGDATETFLFYRGSTANLTPPLRFKRETDGTITALNDGDLPIPGRLIRIETEGRQTRTMSVKPPPPHGSVSVGNNFPPEKSVSPFPQAEPEPMRGEPPPQAVTGPAREDLRVSMREVGMAGTEVDAFMKAWDDTLFGTVLNGGLPEAKPQTTFLYYMPESVIAGFAKVSFDPPPRTFRRAMAVWIRIAPAL